MSTTLPDHRSLQTDPAELIDPVDSDFVGLEEEFGPPPVDPRELARHHVTAVLVSHEGHRWLPAVLDALAQSHRAPDNIVAVDTGSKDDSTEILRRTLGDPAIVVTKRNTGYGAAVMQGIKAADARLPVRDGRTEWIWLLHDDSAPEPGALLALLECAVRQPEAGVIGPKVRGWRDPRQLLEVGLTTTSSGRRYTGLERREYDQGQHDEVKEVLAVGSAGMLVRRDVWDQLGGFDPMLPLFRDDLDFGWRANMAGHIVVVCPDAIVHHVEAAAHGRRRIGATRQRPHLVDRRNALHVQLANAPGKRLPIVALQIILGSLVRTLGFLFGKLPATAFEEMVALGAVILRPDRLIRARTARRRLRKRPPERMKHLFPATAQQLRHTTEAMLSVISGTGAGQDLTVARRRASAPLDSEEDAEFEADDLTFWRVFVRPGVLVPVILLVIALVAARHLLFGGRLMGGALLPAHQYLGDLWSTYVSAWHGVGLGSPSAAPPYLAVVSLISLFTLGNVPAAVTVLMLGCVPLAGLTSYLLLSRLVTSRSLRVWGALVYALLPATTGAIAAGRLGTCVAIVATPMLALAVGRTFGGGPQRLGPFRASWTAGLLLAVVAAFVPLAWLVGVVLVIGAVIAGYHSQDVLLRFAVILAVPPALLVPWTFELLRDPVRLFSEAGPPGPGLSDADLPSWFVALGHPGGPGSAPYWLFAGVIAAAVAVLLRADRPRTSLAGIGLALVALVLGIVVSRVPVTGPTLDSPVAGWPGYATALMVLGCVVAVAAAAEGMYGRLSRSGFSWRQPVVGLLAIACMVTPLVAAGWWAWRGADDPLQRRDPAVLPAYIVEENARPAHPMTLVLEDQSDGEVRYAILRKAGPRMGDAETGPEHDNNVLDQVVGDLVSGRGVDDVGSLVELGIGYVFLPSPADPELAGALDTVTGLVRASATDGSAVWRVDADVSRLRILDPDGSTQPLPSGTTSASLRIDPGPEGRRLLLAENADPGWTATLEDADLEPLVINGWGQGFELPESGGQLEVGFDGSSRTRWLWVQAALAVAFCVLALPSARRRVGVEDVADDELDEAATVPARESVGPRASGGQREPEPVSITSLPLDAPEEAPYDAPVEVTAEGDGDTRRRRRRVTTAGAVIGGKASGGRRRRVADRPMTAAEWLGEPDDVDLDLPLSAPSAKATPPPPAAPPITPPPTQTPRATPRPAPNRAPTTPTYDSAPRVPQPTYVMPAPEPEQPEFEPLPEPEQEAPAQSGRRAAGRRARKQPTEPVEKPAPAQRGGRRARGRRAGSRTSEQGIGEQGTGQQGAGE